VDVNVAETVERLYTGPPEQFIASRSDAVAQARAAGDRALAVRIGQLRKPSLAAWLVNLLALGDELRTAQRELRGAQLRELSVRRRDTIAELAREASRLATAAGRSGREKLPLLEVEKTLAAALSDETLAAEVRAGQLTRPLDYAGFGEAPRPQLRLVRGGAREATDQPDTPEKASNKAHPLVSSTSDQSTPGLPTSGRGAPDRGTELDRGAGALSEFGLPDAFEEEVDEAAMAAARTRRKELAAEIKAMRRVLLEASARLANAQATARNAQAALRVALTKADDANTLVDKVQEQVDDAQRHLDTLYQEDLAT
jgi:hypothetical protein